MQRIETESVPAKMANQNDGTPVIFQGQNDGFMASAQSVPLVAVSSLPVAFLARPNGQSNGPKHPATIEVRLGGVATNAARVAAALGIACAVIAVQAGLFTQLCRELLRALGTRPFILNRKGEQPALTLGVPNGKPGFDLFVQRMRPIKVGELHGKPTKALLKAEIVIVGPVHEANADALAFYDYVTSRAAFVVVIPHPNLLQDVRALAAVAPKVGFFCLNKQEAQLLDPSTDDIDKLALRVRHVLGDGTVPFALTNADKAGWLWDHYNGRFSWLRINPLAVSAVKNDAGGGDILTVAYVCFRRLFGEAPAAALEHALEVAAAHISGQPLTALLNTSSSSMSYGVPNVSMPPGRTTVSWSETSL